MKKLNVDVAIIGTGTAGMSAYREARKYTNSIALVEGNTYGTTCARVGCMPSKLLIAAADAAFHSQHAGGFGIENTHTVINDELVMQRVRAERDRFVGFVLDSVEEFEPSHLIKGYAKFIDDRHLIIENHTEITAGRSIIATGSRPRIPDILSKAGNRLLMNDDIFELKKLPKSLAVFGIGVIGLELDQALSRLGVSVKIFGRSGGLAGIKDSEILHYAEKSFNTEFYLDTNARVLDVVESGNHVEIKYIHKTEGEIRENFDFILAATGRKPNLDSLDLHKAGLKVDAKNVPVFDRLTMQTSAEHIFIAGDVNNDLALLHEAADEGKIAGHNAALFPNTTEAKRRAPLGIVFTDPQIAFVGERPSEPSELTVTGKVSFENQGRSRVMLKNKGLLKVYADRQTAQFTGAEIFGPAAEHMAHLLAWSVQSRVTVAEMLEMPFYHPVVEEGLRTALRDLAAQLDKKNSSHAA